MNEILRKKIPSNIWSVIRRFGKVGSFGLLCEIISFKSLSSILYISISTCDIIQVPLYINNYLWHPSRPLCDIPPVLLMTLFLHYWWQFFMCHVGMFSFKTCDIHFVTLVKLILSACDILPVPLMTSCRFLLEICFMSPLCHL